MVIESERTTQRAVKDALARIDNCKRISIICNKNRAFPGSDYYGYYDRPFYIVSGRPIATIGSMARTIPSRSSRPRPRFP